MQSDLIEIASLIAAFAWRDQGRWTELRSTFTEEGTISVSWYTGSIDGFIDASRQMASGVEAQTKHWIGVPRISLAADRALAETDVVIMARSRVGPLELDMTAYARFFDQLERDTKHGWRIASRVAIYEKDRIDPVGPSLLFWLINTLTRYGKYPAELKHLAFGLERKGMSLIDGIVTHNSSREQALKSSARAWLAEAGNGQLP
jgi:SnoaL-like domain